jgi:hypothetical protein
MSGTIQRAALAEFVTIREYLEAWQRALHEPPGDLDRPITMAEVGQIRLAVEAELAQLTPWIVDAPAWLQKKGRSLMRSEDAANH